jgi:hypothetical protein
MKCQMIFLLFKVRNTTYKEVLYLQFFLLIGIVFVNLYFCSVGFVAFGGLVPFFTFSKVFS